MDSESEDTPNENTFMTILLLLLAIVVIKIILKIRNGWPIDVGCWFCQETVTILRREKSWWLCSFCDQYNGFDKNGDYNCEIPEQYNITETSFCQRSNFSNAKNGLCEDCNHYEEIKLLKLREMENSIGILSTKQVNDFKESFERKYPLCETCKSNVEKILHKQSIWLTQYRMLIFKNKPFQRIVKNREKVGKLIRIFLSILASMSIYFLDEPILPVIGILLQIIACAFASPAYRHLDVFSIVGWIILSSTRTFPTTNAFDPNIDNSIDTYKYFVITLGIVIAFVNWSFNKPQKSLARDLKFKKLDRSTSRSFTESFADDDSVMSEESKPSQSPVNITHMLMTPTAVETPIPLNTTKYTKWTSDEKQTPPVTYAFYNQISLNSLSYDGFSNFSMKSLADQNKYFSDSLTSLDSLSLGPQEKVSTVCPKVFETKVYGNSNTDIFNRSSRSILAAPKLCSVTQTSWVAGGYWQTSLNVPLLSRSSSQSSGFGSLGSNFNPSREPSVSEFDRCSVTSDNSQSQLQTNSFDKNSDLLNFQSRSNAHFNGPITVIANPMWLSVLLCGSLIFNMVVLCTVLLK